MSVISFRPAQQNVKRVILIVLGLSLAANVALVALLWRKPGARDGSTEATAAKKNPTAIESGGDVRVRGTPASSVSAGAKFPGDLTTTWERLADKDPAAFVAKLRAAGFSQADIRGAVYALLRDLQTAERVKTFASTPLAPFWKIDSSGSMNSAQAREMARLGNTRDKIMCELFPEEQLVHELTLQQRYGSLGSDKLEKLAALEIDYTDLRLQLGPDSRAGLWMPWDNDRFTQLDREKQKDIAALLTPGELEDYKLRGSPTAMYLQQELTAFNATEQEYRDLVRLRSAYDDKYRTASAMSVDPAERCRAQTELNVKIKDALGDTRYVAYERSSDPGFQTAYGIVQRLNLPSENVAASYALQRDVRQREAAIRADSAQTPAQRAAQLSALAAEANKKFSDLLTPAGAKDYRQNFGGVWLTNLERSAPPAGK